MGVMKRGSGRGYPRDPEYGFTDDTADHKREEMDQASGYNDMLILNGPADVGWIVDPDFSISASRLTIPHARSAFEHYYNRLGVQQSAHYARRLGARVRDAEGGRVFRDEFVQVCKKTKRNNVSGLDPKAPKTKFVVKTHQESLKYLGMLAIQAMRVIENGISLRGIVGDIRKTDVWTLCEVLDKMQIPACNQPNPYDFDVLPGLDSTLLSKWLRQDDPQIDHINEQIQSGSIVGRNH